MTVVEESDASVVVVVVVVLSLDVSVPLVPDPPPPVDTPDFSAALLKSPVSFPTLLVKASKGLSCFFRFSASSINFLC